MSEMQAAFQGCNCPSEWGRKREEMRLAQLAMAFCHAPPGNSLIGSVLEMSFCSSAAEGVFG